MLRVAVSSKVNFVQHASRRLDAQGDEHGNQSGSVSDGGYTRARQFKRTASFGLLAYWRSLWHKTFVIFVRTRWRDTLTLPMTVSPNHPHD